MKNMANPLLSFFFGSRTNMEDDTGKLVRSSAPPVGVGSVWDGSSAWKAHKTGKLLSNRNGSKIRICMRYLVPDDKTTDEDLHASSTKPKSVWFAWVDSHGEYGPFRKLKPVMKSTVDDMTVNEDDHIESSFLGHAFIFVIRNDVDDDDEVAKWQVDSLDDATVIGGYRPEVLSSSDPDTRSDDYPCHVLEITHAEKKNFLRCVCLPAQRQACSNDFSLVVREANRLEPLVTSGKEYAPENICWWPVCVEMDCFKQDRKSREIFQKDLDYALAAFPGHAYKALKESKTRIYVNKTFLAGPKVRPELVKALCFHPDQEWLRSHGYLEDKAGCVELYDMEDYLKIRDYWGRGGVLIHELAHAYHNKCLPDGYGNAEIRECYEKAMEEGLYDRVNVHGLQGPAARAYACQDQMEYFAELSTAFLGGKKDDEEYNKWYPFNRKQIKEHDPRAYELLCKLWKVRA